jgi:DNA-directed RNA polymerase specialized sigma subunit
MDKYVKNELTEEEARMKVNRKLNDEDLEQFMSRYASLIQYILQLRDGRLHLKVMKLVDDLVQDGMD